jgi:hypothetical protein
MGSCEIFPQTLSHNPNGRYGVLTRTVEYQGEGWSVGQLASVAQS